MARVFSSEKSQFITRATEIYNSNRIGQYSKYLDSNPLFITYYSLNVTMSTADVGLNNIYDELGPKSPLRFNKITEFPVYKVQLLQPQGTYEDGNYVKAIELYDEVTEGQKKTFLREVALMSMAAALEENGDKNSARDIYNAFFDEYGLESFYSSRALFNAARLTEESDKALAISIYEQLVGEFGDYGSEYAKLAQSRIAQLN